MVEKPTEDSTEMSLKLNIDDDDHDRRKREETSTGMSNKDFLKYMSLITLTIQNASLTLFMRAARTQKELFITSTAVIVAELLKFITCVIMVTRDEGKYFHVSLNQ